MNFLSQMQLKGRRALVCGASQGIGRATAETLAEMGAQVILLARNRQALEEVRSGLTGQGHEVVVVDMGAVDELEKALHAFLPIDIVVNNSAGPRSGAITEASSEEFTQAFRQHILSAQKIAQLVLPGMKEKSFGRFINVISTSVKAPIPGLGVSNTIRGAMANWAKTLATEVGPLGITVNNVLPGYTMTPRFESLRKATAEKQKISETQVEDQWKAMVPLRRFAEPREVAAAIGFLASPAASYVSGINIPVDGGRTASL